MPPTEIPLTFNNKKEKEGTDEKDIFNDDGYGWLSIPDRLPTLPSMDNELRDWGIM